MNRLNARIEFWFNVAESCSNPLCLDREGFKHAVAENHRYCDIADAICRGYRK